MIDLNVLNYFLVILTGFGIVWGYRHFSGQQEMHIGEFEYAAFSALWGIPMGMIFLIIAAIFPKIGTVTDLAPMLATLPLFLLAVFFGWIGSRIRKHQKDKAIDSNV